MSDLPLPREIRCVLVPVGNLRLLLPNATVAEVITQPKPEPVEGAPAWLLGRIAWRGWRVPLLSFNTLAGAGEGDSEQSVRVAVLKALGGHADLPFIGVVTAGFPFSPSPFAVAERYFREHVSPSPSSPRGAFQQPQAGQAGSSDVAVGSR